MGAFLVVLRPEAIETHLLGSQAASRRANRFALQGPIHSLMAAVLLGMRGLDEFGDDAEPDPPYGQRGKPPQCRGREGHAVVRADDSRQPVLVEQAEKHGLSEL